MDIPPSNYEQLAGGPTLALAINIVSIVLISSSTAGVARVVYVIARNRCAVQGTNLSPANKHFPIRARMLLGLFISHLWTGITFFVPLLIYLIRPALPLSDFPCDATTILNSTGVLTTHLWTITLAVITYLGLAHPLGTALVRAEHTWFGIGLVIYAVATAMSFGLWRIGGATYVDGYCAFGGDWWKYNELVNLIPRLVVLVIILTIYLRLHTFLRKRRRDVNESQQRNSPETESVPPKELRPNLHPNASLDGAPIVLTWSRTTISEYTRALGQDASLKEPLHENMADFINRKARMLILLFPLSYTVLSVVSVANFAYNATNPQPNIALHAIGRWSLFLQGGLDALTYGWAGARLKRAVHRLEEQRPLGS